MERIYIGTVLILLVSSVAAWWKVEQDRAIKGSLCKEVNNLKYNIDILEARIEIRDKQIDDYRRRLKNHPMKYTINDFPQGPIMKNDWGSIICLNEKPSIAKVMINREYELLENAESVSRITEGGEVGVVARYNKDIEHKHIYCTNEKVLYEIVKVDEYSMRGFDTEYIYELKKVS